MDIVSSASAVVSLVFSFAQVIKTCNDIRSRYQDARRTVDNIKNELETLEGALKELANLLIHDPSAIASRWDSDKTLPLTFQRAIRGFKRTISGLQDDFEPLRSSNGPWKKMDMVKLLWNEDGMRQHLEQLRAQSNALSLLLQVLQTGALSDVKNDLQGVLAAVVELSISTTTNPPDVQSSGIQDRNQIHILDEQGDLIEFDLLEESQQWSALDAPGRATHLEMLERSFAFENISDSEEDMPMKPGRSHRSEAAGSMERLHKAMQASQQECLPSSSRLLVEPQDFRTSSRSRLLNDSARRSESPASNFSADSDTAESRPSEAVVLDDPSPMILSATKGDLVNVTALLDAGGNIESCDQNRRTSLILAAYHGHDELLKFLLERGANVDAIDVDKRTALHYAASEGSSACTELLLLSGASVDIRDFIGETPLHRACRYGTVKTVKLLLSRSLTSLKVPAKNNRNALHSAVHYSSIEAIKAICNHLQNHLAENHTREEDANKTANKCQCPGFHHIFSDRDNYGFTPLQYAIRSKSVRRTSALLQYCSDGVNEPQWAHLASKIDPSKGNSLVWERPLHCVIRSNTIPLLKRLIEAGADVDLVDSNGRSALWLALYERSKEATKLLLCQEASFDRPSNEHGKGSLLCKAIKLLSPSALDCLDVSNPCNDMATPRGRLILIEALNHDRWDIVQSLVKQTNDKKKLGGTLDEIGVIQKAISQGNGDIVEWLIQNSAEAMIRF